MNSVNIVSPAVQPELFVEMPVEGEETTGDKTHLHILSLLKTYPKSQRLQQIWVSRSVCALDSLWGSAALVARHFPLPQIQLARLISTSLPSREVLPCKSLLRGGSKPVGGQAVSPGQPAGHAGSCPRVYFGR